MSINKELKKQFKEDNGFYPSVSELISSVENMDLHELSEIPYVAWLEEKIEIYGKTALVQIQEIAELQSKIKTLERYANR